LLDAGCSMLDTDYWSLVTCHLSLITGHWSLVTCYLSPVTCYLSLETESYKVHNKLNQPNLLFNLSTFFLSFYCVKSN
jgi:hypothetical protein